MILRKKNFELREEGKEPHKGWPPMVDTGLVDANGALVKINRGTIDITGNNHETFNFF